MFCSSSFKKSEKTWWSPYESVLVFTLTYGMHEFKAVLSVSHSPISGIQISLPPRHISGIQIHFIHYFLSINEFDYSLIVSYLFRSVIQ